LRFFFAAGEADVDRAVQEALVHLHGVQLFAHQLQELEGIGLGLAAVLALGVVGLLQQVDVLHPGDLHRVLEAQQQAFAGALLGLQCEQILAHVFHGAAGHLVAVAAAEDLAERALARAVRTHDGVDLARLHLEVDALEDGGSVFHPCLQVGDLQHCVFSWKDCSGHPATGLNSGVRPTARGVGG
jgi:hypothetical protein